ncbi:hypothetical protein HPC38_03915 [Pasteurellaceae bacterium HPA106]|uniref:hypothetical protein n=1 Tax=Spirabiliibacterium pneumoniae TaxID=221400 RepID=UPI001AADFA8A|nr:hypothetical protein [Spirabiliibacterium pneumoniae]MBE2896019.1 hypothetical protein [Spirabiliibacterium pneumoniae]
MMKKNVAALAAVLTLSGCSLFNNSAVIDLPAGERDTPSYMIGYQTATQTYHGTIDRQYDVDEFTRGVQAWYRGDVKEPLESLRQKLYNKLQDSNVYEFRKGAVFAGDVQNNLSQFSPGCWAKLNKPSITQGIYDAMRDLQKQRVTYSEAQLNQGYEAFVRLCPPKAQSAVKGKTKHKGKK